MTDARQILRRLYREVDGFELSKSDEKRVESSGGSATYGEIMPTAMLHLFEALELRQKDVFVDLGAGIGKVVLGAALMTPARKCVGIELARRRVTVARRIVGLAEDQRLVARGRCELWHQSLLQADLSEATVVYTCSTAFASEFTARIVERVVAQQRPLVFVSTQVLDEHPVLRLSDVLRLDMSWKRRRKVYVYRTNRARTAARAKFATAALGTLLEPRSLNSNA